MKEHGDNGSTTTTRGMPVPPTAHLSPSDKLIRDQELQHLVTSSIPSPPYSGLSLINASALVFGADPIYSTHLFASLAASNPNARFQLPLPIPLGLQPALANHPAHQNPLHHQHQQRNLFHHLPAAAVPTFAALPGATLPNAAQLDILSSWVGEQQLAETKNIADDRKITSTTSSSVSTPNANNKNNNNSNVKSKKNRNHDTVTTKNNKNLNSASIIKGNKKAVNNGSIPFALAKTNRKNKVGRPSLAHRHHHHHHESIVSSSENELSTINNKEKFGKETEPININESLIQPFILEKSPVNKINNESQIQKMEIDCSPTNVKVGKGHNRNEVNRSPPAIKANNNRNNNSQGQTSPGSNGARDKVFTCPTCNRCFGYKHVLQNHERTHTGEKPFQCEICLKKFTRDHHLKTHMRLHTGEKPYQCTHCDRQFVQVANLRRHLRVHTGERPYACELCSSRFSDSNQLKAHMLIHKGEKPYTCGECGGQFRRRHHLAHHKCIGEEEPSKGLLFQHHPDDGGSSSSPDTSPPQLLTPASGTGIERNGNGVGGEQSIHESGGSSSGEKCGKRERKCRETRRIIRLESLPVAATISHNATSVSPLSSFLPDPAPEQDHPEDLSITGNSLRGRHYSGSSSSITASSSPSPRSGLGHIHHSTLLLRPYCNSNTSSDGTPDLYSDEDLRAADSSTNGKNESSCDDISSPSHHE